MSRRGDEGSGAGDSEGRAYHGVASCDFLHRFDCGDVRADSVASVRRRHESVCARVPIDRHAVCRRCDEFRGVDGSAFRCEFRLVRVLAHGLVACAGGYDPARARQDEFPWCARVRGAVQHGRIAVGVVVFRGCRFDGVFGVGCGFGLATLVVWASVSVCHLRFRKQWLDQGHSADDLKYRAPGFPFVPIAAIVMCIGALVLVICDSSQRSTLLYMIPFVAICYIGYYASVAWRRKHGELQDDTRGDTQG